MLPLDNWIASIAPVSQKGTTQVVTLRKAGNPPVVVKLRPGEQWLCRVGGGGGAGKFVTALFVRPGEAPNESDMALPTADQGPKKIEARDSTLPFLLACDPELDESNERTAVALFWTGAADDTLVMTKVKG